MEAFGIDFGTTNSAAVGLQRGVERLFGQEGTLRPLPSVVAIHRMTGQLHAIGLDARQHREGLGEDCVVVSSVKSFLGMPDKIWNIGPRAWRPEEIAAEIIKAIRENVRKHLALGEVLMDSAVFSIPVGFSSTKRKALRRAAQLAGIRIASFISEPTAAVCKNFTRVSPSTRVAVLDWGGGTLDISVVEIQGNVVTELATFGKTLGGDEIDLRLAEYVHEQISLQKGWTTPFSAVAPIFRDLLLDRAEQAKIALSDNDSHEIRLNNYCGTPIVTTLNLKTMLSLLRPLMQEAFEALRITVEEQARCSFDEVGALLMVGGTSKLRGLVDHFTEQGWTRQIIHPQDADWNIAQGAALAASSPDGYLAGQDFGLAVSDGSYFPLIQDRDSVFVNQQKEQYFGLVENSREARVVFVQPRRGSTPPYDHVALETLGYLSIPAYGFGDEPVALKTWVDENLVVNLQGRSTRRDSKVEGWQYEKLRFRYQLPKGL